MDARGTPLTAAVNNRVSASPSPSVMWIWLHSRINWTDSERVRVARSPSVQMSSWTDCPGDALFIRWEDRYGSPAGSHSAQTGGRGKLLYSTPVRRILIWRLFFFFLLTIIITEFSGDVMNRLQKHRRTSRHFKRYIRFFKVSVDFRNRSLTYSFIPWRNVLHLWTKHVVCTVVFWLHWVSFSTARRPFDPKLFSLITSKKKFALFTWIHE